MERLLITLDEDSAKVLRKSINMSQTVREALKVYNGDISTDTIVGLKQSYKQLQSYMEEKFEYYDMCFSQLEKLISMLETRM